MTAPHPTSRAADPDFVPSLRLLVEREQYSLTDIGMMFGVTTERVRQWCKQYGVAWQGGNYGQRGFFAYRVWDDALHRFLPVKKRVLREARKERYRETQQARRQATRAARHAELLTVAVQLKERLGRDPALFEIARIVFARTDLTQNQGAPLLINYWGFGNRHLPSRAIGAEIRIALLSVGVLPRLRGEPGHLSPRTSRRQEFCKRGHRISEVGRAADRQCRVCWRWNAANRYRHKRGLPLLPEPIVSGAEP